MVKYQFRLPTAFIKIARKIKTMNLHSIRDSTSAQQDGLYYVQYLLAALNAPTGDAFESRGYIYTREDYNNTTLTTKTANNTRRC